jgi:hypothetical protein
MGGQISKNCPDPVFDQLTDNQWSCQSVSQTWNHVINLDHVLIEGPVQRKEATWAQDPETKTMVENIMWMMHGVKGPPN